MSRQSWVIQEESTARGSQYRVSHGRRQIFVEDDYDAAVRLVRRTRAKEGSTDPVLFIEPDGYRHDITRSLSRLR